MRKFVIRTSLAVMLLSVSAVIALPILIPAPATPRAEASPYASARYACREFIRRDMHDPRSADFGHWAAWPASQDGDRFTVHATFRGANAFGATVQNEVTCSLRRDGETWYPARLATK
jgi:hypothetical protein